MLGDDFWMRTHVETWILNNWTRYCQSFPLEHDDLWSLIMNINGYIVIAWFQGSSFIGFSFCSPSLPTSEAPGLLAANFWCHRPDCGEGGAHRRTGGAAERVAVRAVCGLRSSTGFVILLADGCSSWNIFIICSFTATSVCVTHTHTHIYIYIYIDTIYIHTHIYVITHPRWGFSIENGI